MIGLISLSRGRAAMVEARGGLPVRLPSHEIGTPRRARPVPWRSESPIPPLTLRSSLMPTLQELFLNDENFPRLVADAQALVDSELANKGGISGTAVKAAYKAITAFAPGYYQETLSSMLPDMLYAAPALLGGLRRVRRRGLRRLPGQARRRGVRVAALGDRQHGSALRARGDRQGIPVGARRRGQEHRGRASRPGCHGAEVRLTSCRPRPRKPVAWSRLRLSRALCLPGVARRSSRGWVGRRPSRPFSGGFQSRFLRILVLNRH